tara:strand:+ start:831 stop:2498 length:1668 start_codon:yes stop_codon:yes gene_type:complete
MRIYLSILLLILSFQLEAQLLDGAKQKFTKADTLRGALRPERTCFDVNYYELNIDLAIEPRAISGSNKMFFTTIENFRTLQIDLFENMQIDRIIFKGKELSFHREFNAVFVEFREELLVGSQEMIEIFYNGKPIVAKNAPWDGGFSWKKDEKGNDWIAVSCEGIGASLWWPNKDHLSDEPDSMRVSCTVPENLQFIGNGVLEQDTVYLGKRTMTWKVSYPINNYNVTLNIGKYVNFQDEYYSIEDSAKLILDYWVMPYNLEKAKRQFEQVKPMMAAHERYFGKFPFWNDNYKLVETPYLGMEHQTAIAYGNNYKTGYNGYDFSRIGLDFDYIIIHESGHEYWGNLISCGDIADLWIHESFCTYSEALYVEDLFGYKKSLAYINAKKPTIENKHKILGKYLVNEEGDGDMYNKGMLFLNTIRHIINNDELWFSVIKEMTTKEFAYKTINTNDIIAFFNKKTHQNFTSLFLQYLDYPNIPQLYYSVKKEKGNNYIISYKWLTDVNDFYMPVIIKVGEKEYRLEGANQLKVLKVKKKKKEKVTFDQDKFYFKTMKASF